MESDMKVANFQAVADARQAARGQLSFYHHMVKTTQTSQAPSKKKPELVKPPVKQK